MKVNFIKSGNEKGIALVVTLMVITVLVIYTSALVSVSISQNISADLSKRRTIAYNLAESGLDHAIYWLRLPTTTYPYIGNTTLDGNIPNLGAYQVTITDLGGVAGTPTIRRYKISSTGTYRNASRRLSNFVQIDNFARWIWFTDTETYGNSNVWFCNRDILNGEVHTNGHLNIYRDPFFGGDVKTADNYIKFYNDGNNINLTQTSNPPHDTPTFNAGVELGASDIPMPGQAVTLRTAAANGGIYLIGNSTITLNSNGTINIGNDAYCNNCTTTCLPWPCRRNCCTTTCDPRPCIGQPLPANGALFVRDGDLTVSGTLDGRLTIGSSRDIIIGGDVVYADKTSTSNDMLGIIAENDVMIRDTFTNPAPDNLEIDGCIIALNTSFYKQNWDSTLFNRDTLTILGGIIQQERGPVGTFNGTTGEKRSGYNKSYSYDQRMIGNPPPFMPTTGDYVTLSWQEDRIN